MAVERSATNSGKSWASTGVAVPRASRALRALRAPNAAHWINEVALDIDDLQMTGAPPLPEPQEAAAERQAAMSVPRGSGNAMRVTILSLRTEVDHSRPDRTRRARDLSQPCAQSTLPVTVGWRRQFASPATP